MSAGVSNSKGNESTKGQSSGLSKTKGFQYTDSNTDFSNTSKTAVGAPGWAQSLNKELAYSRAADDTEARDFLSALLNENYANPTGQQNRFGASLQRMFDTQLARARGGTSQNGVARQGFREGAALAGAQDAAIGQGTGAANSLLQYSNPMANLDWARLIAPTTKTDTGTANTTGLTQSNQDTQTKGRQSSDTSMTGSNSGYGITICCFIFMEHFRGRRMPWFVRRSRDEFASGPRVEGYRRMAKYVVPWMRRSKLVRSLVNALMIAPLCGFGGWLYSAEQRKYRFGWLCTPFVVFWFGLWALMGRTINFELGE